MPISTTISITAILESVDVRFGTSGVRGLATDMTSRVCCAYTAAFLQEAVSTANRVILGHDLRPSSPAITQSCAAAIQAQGKEVLFAGTLPTPALAYFALRQKIPAVMVTGSHIPFDRNGIKFYTAEGEISKAHETAITQAVVPDTGTPALPELVPTDAALAFYRERYEQFFPAGFLAGKRIGVYQHSSVARDLLPEILKYFGAEVIPLGRTDEFVPVDTEAVSDEDQAMGRAWAAEHKLDVLLSTDGDADRPLIGDETGNWLRGDVVGLLCAQYLRVGTVVTPVSSTTAIERCGAFSQVVRTRIGSPYVIDGMETELARGRRGVVGFEANGGFLVGDKVERDGRTLDALPTRDAVLPMLALLAMAKERGVPLSGLAESLPRRFTASDRIKEFPTERSRALIAELSASPAKVEALLGSLCGKVARQDETDGLRLTFASEEIVHLRPSGNAPELRCYAEAPLDERAKELVRLVLNRVRAA